MRLTLFLALISAVALNASPSVFDPVSRIALAGTAKHRVATSTKNAETTEYRSMIIEIDSEDAITELLEKGAVIFNRRDNLVLACVPEESTGETESVAGIRRASISRHITACLDKALPVANADAVIAGDGLPKGYDGAGVTVGFSDCGFDPGHIAFSGRVEAVYHTDDLTATITSATTPSEIAAYATDDDKQFHATHVAGILAGNDPSSPYRGVARGARIVGATSTLMDVGILVGVEKVIEHARTAGEPAVVNLSLGSTIGPHDGTDLFCRYLDLCAQDAAILLSAGNDGNTRMSASHVFSESVPVMELMLDSSDWGELKNLVGIADIWASDAAPIEIRLSTIDLPELKQLSASPWMRLTDSDGEPTLIADSDDSVIAGYFEGDIACAGEVSSTNSRSNVTLGFNLQDLEYYPGHPWARHVIRLEIKSTPGTRVDICTEGKMCFRRDDTEFSNMGGSPMLSVSSLACGDNTVCVGSYTSRDHTPYLDGSDDDHSGFVQAGTASKFSAYGTLVDNRTLPHFCAPGAYLVSAYNRYALAANPDLKNKMAAVSTADPDSYYYAECGTSMASPLAAGIFALWLQADPTLTGTDLRDIAISTASTAAIDSTDPRTGAGIIDAVAGLRKILGESGEIDRVLDLVSVRREGSRLVVDGLDGMEARIEAYTPSGSRVSPEALPVGPIIVRITAADSHHVAKIQ